MLHAQDADRAALRQRDDAIGRANGLSVKSIPNATELAEFLQPRASFSSLWILGSP